MRRPRRAVPGVPSPSIAVAEGLAATSRRSVSRTITGSARPPGTPGPVSRRRSPPLHQSVTLRDPWTRPGADNDADAKVLIVEDDEVIAQGMARHLGAAGFDAVWVGNGEQGLARLRYEQPDACVLDLMLPGPRRLEADRDRARRGSRDAGRRRLRARDRARPRPRARDRRRRLPREAVLDEGARRPRPRSPRARDPPRGDAARRADRDRGAARRPARGAGVHRRQERRADADRVPPALPARARPGPRRHPRRAAAEALGHAASRTATGRSTCSCAGCGRRSTSRLRVTPSSRRGTASATSSKPYPSSLRLP